MKFLITGDIHLRSNNPENRIDNFFEAQYHKMKQIFQLALDKKCQYILCPGDVFDTSRPSFEILEKYIELMNQYNIGKNKNIQFLTVWGQHDQRFRTKERTALKLMEFLGYMKTFTKISISDNIDLYGCDYGNDIPEIENKNNFNILLIHKTILDKPQWKGQEDFLLSEKLAKKSPYFIIINGDYHLSTYYEYKDQTILNCGCLVRKTIAEVDLKPHVYILNINDNLEYTLEKIQLKFEPTNKVFKEEALTRQITKENEKLNEFIESIRNNEISSSLDFKKNLEILMQSIDKPVKDIILKELEKDD